MRIKEGLELRQIGSKSFILEDVGAGVLSQKMITFNTTAAYLWTSLKEKEFSAKDVSELLKTRYSISDTTATEDANSIIRAWVHSSLIECS